MITWFSPFYITNDLRQKLIDKNIYEFKGNLENTSSNVIFIYLTPHKCIEDFFKSTELKEEGFLKIFDQYKMFAKYFNKKNIKFLASWHLNFLDIEKIETIFFEENSLKKVASTNVKIPQYPSIEPFIASFLRNLIQNDKDFFKHYIDLELNSELLGREPDTEYIKRINNCAQNTSNLLVNFYRRINEFKNYSDNLNNSLELQIEEEKSLEKKLRSLEDKNKFLEEENSTNLFKLNESEEMLFQLNQNADKLEKNLKNIRQKLNLSIEELEINQKTLHHTQDELEKYFSYAKGLESFCNKQFQLLERSRKIIIENLPNKIMHRVLNKKNFLLK